MRTYWKMILAILSGVGLVVVVLLRTNLPNKTANGFSRIFIPAKVQLLGAKKLPPIVRGVAGMHEDSLYLYTDSLNQLLKIDIFSLTTTTLQLPIRRIIIDRVGTAFSTKATPEFVHIFANNLPGIIILNRHSSTTALRRVKRAFTSQAVVSNTNCILRQVTSLHNGSQFVAIQTDSEEIKSESALAQSDQDRGIFSGDGQLHYDSHTQLLVYTHYYYNSVVGFDTLLKPSIQFQTIDTIQRIRKGRSQPLVTNQKSCTGNGVLYICSNLKADNETYENYRNNIPVDLYHIRTGTYLGSFYLPVSNGKLIKSFTVDEKILAALYHDGKLMLFSIHHILQALEPPVPLR